MWQILAAGAAGLSAVGQIAAGQAQQQASELNAFNIETDKVRSEIETKQRHNDRMEQYRSNLSANIASFAAAGRDVTASADFAQQQDRSVQAFLNRQKEIAFDDTRRSDFMGAAEAARLQQKATATRIEGRAERQASTIGAFTTLTSGLSEYYRTR